MENANYANYAGTAYGVSSCGGTSTVWINGPTSTNGVSINGYSLYLGANRNISVVLNGKTVTTMNDSGININSMNINLGACVQGAKTNIYGFNVDIIGSSMLNLNGGQHVSIKTASVGPAITCSNSASDTSPVRLLTLSANSAQLAIDIGKQRSELTFSSGDNLSGKVSLVAYNTTPPQGSRTFYLPNTGGVLATESTSYSTVLNEFANLGIQVDVGPISGTIQSRTGTAQVAGTDYYTAAASVNIADSDFWDGKPLRMVEITSVTVLAPFTNATANIDGNRISLNYKGPTANTNVTFKYVCKCKASIIRSL